MCRSMKLTTEGRNKTQYDSIQDNRANEKCSKGGGTSDCSAMMDSQK